MKKLSYILLLLTLATTLFAQKGGKKLYLGFQAGLVIPIYQDYALPKYKLGLPSFSYSASLENRLSVNKKLSFSFQYGVSYLNFKQKVPVDKANETGSVQNLSYRNSDLSVHTSVNALLSCKKDASMVLGFGVNKPVYSFSRSADLIRIDEGKTFIKTEDHHSFSANDPAYFNPYLIIGIENSTKLFNKKLYYSLQYNFGFMPYKYQLMQNTNSSPASYYQGVNFGLKYKY